MKVSFEEVKNMVTIVVLVKIIRIECHKLTVYFHNIKLSNIHIKSSLNNYSNKAGEHDKNLKGIRPYDSFQATSAKV